MYRSGANMEDQPGCVLASMGASMKARKYVQLFTHDEDTMLMGEAASMRFRIGLGCDDDLMSFTSRDLEKMAAIGE